MPTINLLSIVLVVRKNFRRISNATGADLIAVKVACFKNEEMEKLKLGPLSCEIDRIALEAWMLVIEHDEAANVTLCMELSRL